MVKRAEILDDEEESDHISVDLPVSSRAAPSFYQTIQGELQNLRSKVDQQLTDIVTVGQSDIHNMSNHLRYQTSLDVTSSKKMVTSLRSNNNNNRSKSPGTMRQLASPSRNSRTQRRSTVSAVPSVLSGSSSLYPVVSADVTETAGNLTRHANRRKRRQQRALLQEQHNESSSESHSSSSSYMQRALVSPSSLSSSAPTHSAVHTVSSGIWSNRSGLPGASSSNLRDRAGSPISYRSEKSGGLRSHVRSEEADMFLDQIAEGDDEDSRYETDEPSPRRSRDVIVSTSSVGRKSVPESARAGMMMEELSDMARNHRRTTATTPLNRRSEAYEKYRQQSASTQRPWRDMKARAADVVSFDSDEDDSGIVVPTTQKQVELVPDQMIDYPKSRDRYSQVEDGAALVELISADTSIPSGRIDCTEAPSESETSGFVINNKDVNKNISLLGGRENVKRKSATHKPSKFFPDDDDNGTSEVSKSTKSREMAPTEIKLDDASTESESYNIPIPMVISDLTPAFSTDHSSRRGKDPPKAAFEEKSRNLLGAYSVRSKANLTHQDAPALSSCRPCPEIRPDADGQSTVKPSDSSQLSMHLPSGSSSNSSDRLPDAPASFEEVRKNSRQGYHDRVEECREALGTSSSDDVGSFTSYVSHEVVSNINGHVHVKRVQVAPSVLTDVASYAMEAPIGRSIGDVHKGFLQKSDVPSSTSPSEHSTAMLGEIVPVSTKSLPLVREQVDSKTIKDPYGDYGVYTGVLVHGLPHGHGTMSYADGRTYCGDWKVGRWNGQGKTCFSNGDTYTGEYQMDKRHGVGRYAWKDGRMYDGDFFEDHREGKGTYQFPDGSVYTGGFKAGLRHGQGCYRFADGSVYSGEFKEGKYDGVGECIWADGRCYRGEWSNGRAHGYGVEIRADGTVRHDGEWRTDRPVRRKTKNQLSPTGSNSPRSQEDGIGSHVDLDSEKLAVSGILGGASMPIYVTTPKGAAETPGSTEEVEVVMVDDTDGASEKKYLNRDKSEEEKKSDEPLFDESEIPPLEKVQEIKDSHVPRTNRILDIFQSVRAASEKAGTPTWGRKLRGKSKHDDGSDKPRSPRTLIRD